MNEMRYLENVIAVTWTAFMIIIVFAKLNAQNEFTASGLVFVISTVILLLILVFIVIPYFIVRAELRAESRAEKK